MFTISDFPTLPIKGFRNETPRAFKNRDLDRAEELGLNTVADVINDTRVGTCKSMKAILRTQKDACVNMYNYVNGEYKLPANIDPSFTTAEMVKQLFKELDELVTLVEYLPFESISDSMVDRIKDVLNATKLRYLHNLTDIEIEGELGFSRETSRTHHNKFLTAIMSGLENDVVTNVKPFLLQFGLSGLFIERMKEVIDAYKPGIPSSILTQMIGSKDAGIVQFFLDILDASLYTSVNGTFKGEYIVSGFPLVKFDLECGVLFDMMEQEHEYVTGLRAYLLKNLNSDKPAKADAILRMAEYCGQFNIEDKNGIKFYQLKYEYLKHDDMRNERILFENRGKYLSKAEMEDEYNSRARKYRLDEKKGNDYRVGATERISSQNGTWHWIEDGEETITDPRPFIKQFVEDQGGTVTFNQVKDYLAENNVTLKDSSIRAYLTSFCKHHRSSCTYVIKNSAACTGRGDITPDIIKYLRGQSSPVYVSMIAAALSTSPGRVSRIIDLHPEIFTTTKGKKIVYVTLNPAYTSQTINIKKTSNKKEPQHKIYMRTMAIDRLKKANGGPLPMKELADEISKVIANTSFSRTVVYKVFNHEIFNTTWDTKNKNAKLVSLNMDVYKTMFSESVKEYDWDADYEDLKDAVKEFTKGNIHCKTFDVMSAFDTMNDIMKGNRANLNQDSYFWLIQELLYKYLTQETSKMEREFLRDNLAYKYEAFLDNYCYSKTGRHLDVKGLATRLGVLQNDGLLPARYSDWSSTYTTKLVNTRNQVHTIKRDLDSTIKSDILDFLVLYLYTASM